jgi:hypothetical protein
VGLIPGCEETIPQLVDHRSATILTGLKIRLRRSHQNVGTRNTLTRFDLACSLPEPSCTRVQRNDDDPALNPAPNRCGVVREAMREDGAGAGCLSIKLEFSARHP